MLISKHPHFLLTDKCDNVRKLREWSEQLKIANAYQPNQRDQQEDHVQLYIDLHKVVVDQLFDICRHKDYVDAANAELINDEKAVNDGADRKKIFALINTFYWW